MISTRKIAIIVGILFILADVTLFTGEAFYKPILSAPDYLENAYPNKVKIVFGVLLEFVGYLGLVLIPVLLYPILKKHHPILALGYVSFRLFEVVLLSVAQVNKLSLINLSQHYLEKSRADTAYFEQLGNATKSIIYWVNSDGFIYILVFVIGGLLFHTALYQSKLLPRWIAIWGLIADVALITAFIFVAFDLPSALSITLVLPIAFQEIVMSIWMIVKGFNSTGLNTKSN